MLEISDVAKFAILANVAALLARHVHDVCE
jgi:hypothetical protein